MAGKSSIDAVKKAAIKVIKRPGEEGVRNTGV